VASFWVAFLEGGLAVGEEVWLSGKEVGGSPSGQTILEAGILYFRMPLKERSSGLIHLMIYIYIYIYITHI